MKKIVFASALALTLAGAVLTNDVFANDRLVATQSADGKNENVLSSEVLTPASGNVLVGLKGEFLTPDQQAILDAINAIRKEAADEGLVDKYVPIKWSTDLEKAAFARAAEASVTMDHTRLSGKEIWSAFPSGNSVLGENLGWNHDGFLKALEQWRAEKADYVKKKPGGSTNGGSGHYQTLISPKFTHMGIAAFKNPNNPYNAVTIAQAFGDAATSEELVGSYGPAIQYAEVTSSNLSTVKNKAVVVEKALKEFRTSSSDQSGWVKTDGKWYFYESGDLKTGWVKTGGKWYYLDDLGVMQTGFVKVDGSWYYLSSSGAMFTGWGTDGNRWFYFDGSGAMKTGWFKVGQYWYYAYGSGALAVSTTTPDGYKVNGNGEWVN